MVDTLRFDALGCNAPQLASTTPAIDRFAADCVRFSRAIATSGWTVPSISSLLTGTWPTHHKAIPDLKDKEALLLTGVSPDVPLASELLQRHDLLFYIEGGRSYSGELMPPKTGLLHAAMQAQLAGAVIVPLAVAYDVVLEDHILAHQGAKRRQRPFGREVAEMVRYAVGYQSRAVVTFGRPIPLNGCDPGSRREVMAFAYRIRDAIGLLYKILPTAVLAAAMRPSISRKDLELRADAIIDVLRASGANLGVASGRQAVDEGVEPLAARNIIHVERGGRFRVRERTVLRYYARTIQHLLTGSRRNPRTH